MTDLLTSKKKNNQFEEFFIFDIVLQIEGLKRPSLHQQNIVFTFGNHHLKVNFFFTLSDLYLN